MIRSIGSMGTSANSVGLALGLTLEIILATVGVILALAAGTFTSSPRTRSTRPL